MRLRIKQILFIGLISSNLYASHLDLKVSRDLEYMNGVKVTRNGKVSYTDSKRQIMKYGVEVVQDVDKVTAILFGFGVGYTDYEYKEEFRSVEDLNGGSEYIMIGVRFKY